MIEQEYKQYRNALNSTIKEAKRRYYQNIMKARNQYR